MKHVVKKLLSRLAALVDRWIPPYAEQVSAEERLKRRYYQYLCTTMAFFLTVFAAHSTSLRLYRLAAGQALIVVVIFASTMIYRRTRSVDRATQLILALTAPLTFFRLFVTGGITSPILLGFPVISTLSLMTLSLRSALAWTGVHVAFGAFYFYAHHQGWAFAVQAPESVLSNVRIAMICTVQMLLIGSVYCIRHLNARHRGTARDQGEKITDLVRALSHDLSSPLMTMQHWLQSARKKGLGDEETIGRVLAKVQGVSASITAVRTREATAAGKTGDPVVRADVETMLDDRLLRFAGPTIFIAYSATALVSFALGLHGTARLQGAVVLASVAGWLLYRTTRSLYLVGTVIMAAGLAAGCLEAWQQGGIGAPAFLAWPIIPVFAGMLLPPAAAGAWTGAYILIALAYDCATRAGFAFPNEASPAAAVDLRFTIFLVVQALVVAAIIYLKRENGRFRLLLEHQGVKKAELLRTMTNDIGGPLAEATWALSDLPEGREFNNARKAARSSLAIIAGIERLEMEARSDAVKAVSTVDLREIVREVAFLQQGALAAKQIAWEESLPRGDGPVLVHGERSGLAYQVLNNLVSNAVKFTGEGGRIVISVGERESCWEILVRDSGIGIPRSLLPKLFSTSEQTTRVGTGGEAGTGFGMPIVKKFVEQYGGSLVVESTTIDVDPENHGTLVRIELPKLERSSGDRAA